MICSYDKSQLGKTMIFIHKWETFKIIDKTRCKNSILSKLSLYVKRNPPLIQTSVIMALGSQVACTSTSSTMFYLGHLRNTSGR